MTITTVARPYVLTFSTGNGYLLNSDEAQRLLDAYPAMRATRNRVVLRGDDGTRSMLSPATHGGGPAFIVTR